MPPSWSPALPARSLPTRALPTRALPTRALGALTLLLGLTLVAGLGLALPASAAPVEDYAAYEPATGCSPHAKPGTTALGHWMVREFGGSFGGIARACTSSTSEHEEGRAFDWTLDARSAADRERAGRFLRRVLATDRRGNTDALARRMGIMYLIWNDHSRASYRRFEKEAYLSSSCSSRQSCSQTLRHRDHLHVSLSKAGGAGRTSWYEGRLH